MSTSEFSEGPAARGASDDSDSVLRQVFEALGGTSGPDFLDRLLASLSSVLGAETVFVGRLDASRSRIETVAVHDGTDRPPPLAYDIAGSPCESVLDAGPAVHPHGVAALFPHDALLRESGVEAYGGVPLRRRDGVVFALMVALSRQRFARPDLVADILNAFAARAGAELETIDHAAELALTNAALRAAVAAHEASEARLREARAHAERSEQRLLDAIESVPVGFVMFDGEDRLVLSNRQYRALYPELAPVLHPGTPFAEICGVLRSDIDADGSRPGFDVWLARRMERHRAADGVEVSVATYGGRRVLASETRMADGGVVGVHVDVSAMAVLQDQLAEARARAEAALAVRSRFLANISHELRTPLNAVIGFSELMLMETQGPLPGAYREHVGIIKQSGEFLLSLIVDILDMSRIEAGKMTVAREPVDLAAVVEDARAMLSLQAARKGLRLDARVTTGLPPILGERRRALQIVQNLLSNAVKFTEQGGIVLSLTPDGAGQRITVTDTGRGMSEEDIAYAMVPFQQARQLDPLEVMEGTGLGLPLVKALVELMDGRLAIDSAPGVGTTVTVWLPTAGQSSTVGGA